MNGQQNLKDKAILLDKTYSVVYYVSCSGCWNLFSDGTHSFCEIEIGICCWRKPNSNELFDYVYLLPAQRVSKI